MCFFFSFVSGKWPLVLQNLSQFGLVSIVDIFVTFTL